MPVLKTPPKQIRSATIQVRVEEEINTKLRKYAEFIDSTPAYVVSETLRLLFSKDAEFRQWLARDAHDFAESPSPRTSVASYSPMDRSTTEEAVLTRGDGSAAK